MDKYTLEKRRIYLAGKITGDPEYRSKFQRAEKALYERGYIVLNPAWLPSEGFTWEAYIRMSTAMLDECDAACFLPDWTDSTGAQYEYGRSVATDKEIIMYTDLISMDAGAGGQ